jgi:hypothetical protein
MDQTALVLTNHHVVDDASEISVELGGGEQFTASTRGSDETRDLALLEICCSPDFTAIAFGDSIQLQVGTDVVAVGYPLPSIVQGDPTITRGIVSAIRFDEEQQRWELQHDAAINPGNSGGPLLTGEGELVGVNTEKIVGAQVEGLGFAIMERTISELLPRLRAGEVVATPTPAPFVGFGPISGELVHEGFVVQQFAGVDIVNGTIRVSFTNPYGRSAGFFDYGVTFRDRDGSSYSIIVRAITPRNRWYFYLNNDLIQQGGALDLKTGAGQVNNLTIVLRGDVAVFVLNGSFLADTELDVGALRAAGDVSLIAGFFLLGQSTGDRTSFSGFAIEPVMGGV